MKRRLGRMAASQALVVVAMVTDHLGSVASRSHDCLGLAMVTQKDSRQNRGHGQSEQPESDLKQAYCANLLAIMLLQAKAPSQWGPGPLRKT